MEQKPKNSRNYTIPYLLLGLLISVILVGLLVVVLFIFQNKAFTWENLVSMFTTNPLFFAYILVLVFYSTMMWALLGNQRTRTEGFRRYAEWVGQNQKRDTQQVQAGQVQVDQKHQVEVAQLNQQMASQKSKFQELEAIIHRGKQQWEATFDAVDDLIILADEKGSILRCNRATGETFHLGYSQIIGRGLDELFSSGSDSLLGMNPGDKRDMKLPHGDTWYQISKNHLLIDGKQEGWVYIFRNITTQKQAYRDQQRLTQYYELLVNNSPLAIVTLNQEDRIIDCNPAFESLFQYNKQEAIGAKIDSLIIPAELAFEANGLADAVHKGVKVQSITQRKKKDGSPLDVEIYGIPVVLGGKQVGSLGLYHDISNLVHQPKEGPVPVPVPIMEEPVPETTPETGIASGEDLLPESLPATGEAEGQALSETEGLEAQPLPETEGMESQSLPAAGEQEAQPSSEAGEQFVAPSAEVAEGVEDLAQPGPTAEQQEAQPPAGVMESEEPVEQAAIGMTEGEVPGDQAPSEAVEGSEQADQPLAEAGEQEVPLPGETPGVEEQEEQPVPSTETDNADVDTTAPATGKGPIPIEKIEGIGSNYSTRLNEIGVTTTSDLLELGKSRKGREEIVEKTGISSLLILKWVNMADLMRIKGVGEEYSELLERAGVDTVKELRNRDPKNLFDSIAAENEANHLVRQLPTLSDVESWVKEANESDPVMTY